MAKVPFIVPDIEVDGTTLTVDETNNRVGIGTNSPGVTLDVVGVIKGSDGVVTLTSAGAPSATVADGALAVDTTNDKLYIRTGGVWVEVSGGGGSGVTISDTPPASPSTADLWYESDTGDFFIYYDSTWVDIGGTIPIATVISDTDGDTKIQTEESADEDKIRFDTAGVERAVIDSSGLNVVSGNLTVDTNTLFVDSTNNRVGVGSASPAYRLDVNAGVDSDLFRLRGADDSLIFSVNLGDFYIKNDQQNNGLVIYDGTAGVEILYNNTAVFEADSGGVKANGEIIWHDTGWTAASLVNNWTSYTGRRTARYRKIGDEVFVEGEVDGGTITAGTTVFTLPSGYRPPQAFVVPIASAGVTSGQSARFYVLTTGAVTIYGVSSNADVAFNFCFSTI